MSEFVPRDRQDLKGPHSDHEIRKSRAAASRPTGPGTSGTEAPVAQQKLAQAIDQSPRQLAQRRRLEHAEAGTAQRIGAEDEELLQGKMDPAQLQLDEEEPMQGKMDPAQLQLDEEEPMQGKMDPAQLQPDEEEPLQGKMGPAQLEPDPGANQTGMPDALKSGLENLSGMDLSGVRVNYDSPKPAQLNALAYAQGKNIEVAAGQEQHLPHEGWHAVQQMQGRVTPTAEVGGVPVNDSAGLEREADVMGARALEEGHSGSESAR